MEHRLNWELIDYCTNIGIWIVFLVGFYAGYCCRKSWGNWLMFYSLAGGMVIMLIISLLFQVIGINGFGVFDEMVEYEKVIIRAHQDEKEGPDNYLNFVLQVQIGFICTLDVWFLFVVASHANCVDQELAEDD